MHIMYTPPLNEQCMFSLEYSLYHFFVVGSGAEQNLAMNAYVILTDHFSSWTYFLFETLVKLELIYLYLNHSSSFHIVWWLYKKLDLLAF